MDPHTVGTVSTCAKLVSALATYTSFGAGIHILQVDCPARLSLPTSAAMVQHFQASLMGCKHEQQFLLCTSMVGAAVAWLTDSDPTSRLLMAASIILLISNIPWTVICLVPINSQLMDPSTAAKKDSAWVVDMLTRWARRHTVRCVTTGLAVLCHMGYWANKAGLL